MTERDIVKHADWRQIIAALSRDDYDRLWATAQLYYAVCGVPKADDMFSNESVNEACHDLARTSPLYGHKVPPWKRSECAKLMASRTLLPTKTCEAFVDGEMVNSAIAAGEMPDSEPMAQPSGNLPRDKMTAEQILKELHDSIRVVPSLERVTLEVLKLSPPDPDGCNWYVKHSGLPADCPPKTVRLFFELVQVTRDACELIDTVRWRR